MIPVLRSTLIIQVLIFVLLNSIKRTDAVVYSCNPSASCGCSKNAAIVTRIVGGENASSATWGWAVSIRIGSGSLCGGSIISSSWIITAAHCIEIYTASDFLVFAGSNTRWSGTQNRTVSKVIKHTQFNSGTYEYDIALLKLSSPLNMSDPYVSTLCLPSVSLGTLSATEWPTVETNVVAVGWGRLSENGIIPTALQQVTLQTVNYNASTCNPVMSDWRLQFCATVPNGTKDTCQGDSGGPMMMFTSSNQWVLVGLTSSGIGCARPQYAGLYTRVAAFESWIRSNSDNSTLYFWNSTSSNSSNTTATTSTTLSPNTTTTRITAVTTTTMASTTTTRITTTTTTVASTTTTRVTTVVTTTTSTTKMANTTTTRITTTTTLASTTTTRVTTVMTTTTATTTITNMTTTQGTSTKAPVTFGPITLSGNIFPVSIFNVIILLFISLFLLSL